MNDSSDGERERGEREGESVCGGEGGIGVGEEATAAPQTLTPSKETLSPSLSFSLSLFPSLSPVPIDEKSEMRCL
jgi:hypothetical protein